MKKIFSISDVSMGARYSITLLLVISVIIGGAKFLNITDPTWAIISGIVCTELDIGQVRSTVMRRILATLIGALVAYVVLRLFGPGYLAVVSGIVVITLFCHCFVSLENAWKLAVATGAMILIAGLEKHVTLLAEEMAWQRTTEVVFGSLVAGMFSFALSFLFKKL